MLDATPFQMSVWKESFEKVALFFVDLSIIFLFFLVGIAVAVNLLFYSIYFEYTLVKGWKFMRPLLMKFSGRLLSILFFLYISSFGSPNSVIDLSYVSEDALVWLTRIFYLTLGKDLLKSGTLLLVLLRIFPVSKSGNHASEVKSYEFLKFGSSRWWILRVRAALIRLGGILRFLLL